jgi:hypothetical protein
LKNLKSTSICNSTKTFYFNTYFINILFQFMSKNSQKRFKRSWALNTLNSKKFLFVKKKAKCINSKCQIERKFPRRLNLFCYQKNVFCFVFKNRSKIIKEPLTGFYFLCLEINIMLFCCCCCCWCLTYLWASRISAQKMLNKFFFQLNFMSEIVFFCAHRQGKK